MADLAATFNSADQSTPGHYGPAETALLLLDFHALFVEKIGGEDAASALKVAAQLRKWAKSQGIVIIHGLIDINTPPYATLKGLERLLPILNMLKSRGAEEPAELLENADENDVTFFRTPGFVSALKSPGLPEFLQKKGIKSLIMCGLSTSGCVMRTAVPATDDEYVVSVISDGCADPKEGVHEMMTKNILTTRGWVITAAEFQEGYVKARSGK